jgi:hypothetical protein
MLYNIALFTHIVGVLGIFTSIALELASLFGLRRARSMEEVRAWTGIHKVIAWGFPLAALLTLGAGLFMAWDAWGWNVPWIDVAFLVLITMGLLGRLVNARRHQQLYQAMGTTLNGPLSDELSSQLADPVLWSSVLLMTAVGLGVVFLMTVKPDLLGSFITLAIAVVVGLGVIYVLGGVGHLFSFDRSSRSSTSPLPEGVEESKTAVASKVQGMESDQ